MADSIPQTDNAPVSGGQTDGSLESAFTDAMGQDAAPDTGTPPAQDTAAATVPESPVEEAPAPTEAPAGNDAFDGMRDAAREMGIEVDNLNSPELLAAALLDHSQQIAPFAEYGRQAIPYADKVRELALGEYGQQPAPGATNAPQPTAPAAPAQEEWTADSHFEKQYGGPVWKQEHLQALSQGMVRRDHETGLYAPAPGAEFIAGPLVQDINAAAQHSAKFWQDMSQKNPLQVMYSHMEEPIQRLIDQRVQNALGAHQNQQQTVDYVQQFEAQYGDQLYLTDPGSGQQIPTEAGKKLFDQIAALEQRGLTDPQFIVETAAQLTGFGQAPAPQQTTGETTTATAPAPAQQSPPPAEPKSFLQNALDRAAHSPSAGTATSNNDVPNQLTEGDLDNVFTNAFAAQQK